jgi:outer membrane protein OmpA-like peptidoglycan-associated protein
MRSATASQSLLVSVLFLLLGSFPLAAQADAIQVRMITKVGVGQKPKLEITALQNVERVEVMLNRDDGKNVGQNFGAIGVGEMREVLLDGKPGKHHYSGRVTCVVDGEPQDSQIYFDTLVGGELTVIVDKTKVDLAAGRMPIQVSSPDGKVELRISGASDGEPLLEHEQEFAGHDPATPLFVTWKPLPKGIEVGRVDVKVTDGNGAFKSFAYSPWSINIPHEEVNFATDSASIDRAEVPKLQASLGKIADALAKHKNLSPPPKLYIAGHTDTVGTAAHNLDLSRRRAQSIAGWFRKNGLRIPISYEGFGEFALLVATPDNTDERRNRRVDYILATEDPVLKATEFQAVWKPIK